MDNTNPWSEIKQGISELLAVLEEDDVISLEIQQGRAFHDGRPYLQTLPIPPSSRRHYFKKILRGKTAESTFGRAFAKSMELMNLAFSNNDYLLAYYGMKPKQQQEVLWEQGILYRLATIKNMKEGRGKSVSLILPAAMAIFWGEPLNRFLTQDYAGNKLQPYRKQPPKKITFVTDRQPSDLRRVYHLAAPLVK
jgi:hypothetical protein